MRTSTRPATKANIQRKAEKILNMLGELKEMTMSNRSIEEFSRLEMIKAIDASSSYIDLDFLVYFD